MGTFLIIIFKISFKKMTKISLEKLEEALGLNGIGMLTVKNVPGYLELREKLLPLSRKFGEGLDFPGSYYANPQYDEPSPQKDNTPDAAPGTYTHPNVWPKEDIPEFEETFKKLDHYLFMLENYWQ